MLLDFFPLEQVNCDARNLYLSVCCPHILKTVYPMYFILDRFVAEDPQECSVQFVLILDTLNINKS